MKVTLFPENATNELLAYFTITFTVFAPKKEKFLRNREMQASQRLKRKESCVRKLISKDINNCFRLEVGICNRK